MTDTPLSEDAKRRLQRQKELAYRWLTGSLWIHPSTASDLLGHGNGRLARDAMLVAAFAMTIAEEQPTP
jgi:hypothetical protein